MVDKNSKQFNIYDFLYFLKRNYVYICIITVISILIGGFFTLRTKPIYSSYAEIEIVEDDNSGIAKMPGFEAFSDDKKLEDKIRNIGLRPIAEATIDKLAKPVNSISLTSDYRLLYNFKEHKNDSIFIIYKGQKNKIILEAKKGCGTYFNDIRSELNIDADSPEFEITLGDLPFNSSNIVIPDGEFESGCELPKYRQMYILNTKPYNPVGFRETFDGLISFFGIWPVHNDKLYPNDYTFTDGDRRAFVNRLKESLSIEHIKETSHIKISVENLGSKEAADIVSCLIESYEEEEKKYANERTSDQIEFLKDEINNYADSLSSINKDILSFQKKKNIFSPDGNAAEYINQWLELSSKGIEQDLKLKDLKKARELYQEESQKIDIPKVYGLAIEDTLKSLDIRIQITEDRIKNIKYQVRVKKDSIDKLPGRTIEFDNLIEKKLKFSKTNTFLTEKLKNAELIYNSAQPGITVRVDAIENREKIKPNVYDNLLLSFFIGLIGSTLILFLVEYFNNSIKTVEDLEKYGLNILAIIPSIGSNKKRKSKISNNGYIERTLITREDPKSPISEAYRTLRTSIMYSSESSDNNAKVVMVSSPGPGEGKTTTVANLAITYANLGKKTLLIDGDLRKPVINKVFNLDKDKGLTKYIVQNCSIEDIIQSSEIDNLNIICSGINPPNPSELLNSAKMKNLLNELRSKFDIILIDTPPIIAVTDALVLSKIVDNFILVCRSGVSQKGALDRSIKSLEQVGGKFDGAILNAISEGDNYGSGYYYNYYQYYYNEDEDK